MPKRSRVESNNASRNTPESRITLSNDTSKYGGANDQPGLQLVHKKAMPSTRFTLTNDMLTRILCPMITVNRTGETRRYNWSANQEKIIECCSLPLQALLELKRKSFMNPARYWASLSSSSTDNDIYNLDFRYQGGKYKYTIVNTCNNVVFLEIREFKPRQTASTSGLTFFTETPYALWRRDCANNQTFGDLPGGTTQVAPDNNNNLGELPNAEQQLVISNGDDYVVQSGVMAVGMRPNKRSPQLRGNYDVGEKCVVKLCPGQSFTYEQVIHPFFLSKNINAYSGTEQLNAIQWYTRFVHIYARSQWNTDGALQPQVNALAPGPGSIHIVRECVETIRSIPGCRPHVQVDRTSNSNNTAGFGPFANIGSNSLAAHENPAGSSSNNEVLYQG